MDWDWLIPIGVIGVIIVIVVVAVIWTNYLEKKRREAMEAAAGLMGFTWTAAVPGERITELRTFELFNRGHSPHGRNLLSGKVGDADIILIDYRYSTGSGKHKQTHDQTVIVLPDGGAGLPNFQLTPENFFHKIGQLFGYQDINFEENPTFSRRYLLRGPNEAAIRQAFTTPVLDHFAESWGWSVEVNDGQLLVYRASNLCAPDKCPEFVAEAARIREVFTSGASVQPRENESPYQPDAPSEG
jgi:hypothetical protein